ncbi:MAG: alpha/beta fold hydrolase [Betaproteobacteria bacterium]|nr:alpha/beta fold hydrolase [Betaproteobacteria bacterium]
MLVSLVRAALVVEALLIAALAAGLCARGWSLPAAIAAPVGLALGVRLAIVCFSMAVAHLTRSPRDAAEQLGPAGTLALVLGEWRAMLANNLFYLPLENLAVPADPPRGLPAEVAVLVVHGYFSNRGILRGVLRSLSARGATPVYTFNFHGLFRPIDELAEQLAMQVDLIVRPAGAKAVVIVAHSMGGLVARAYLARHGSGSVARLVTIASPHHGTRLARLGMGTNARQMREGSEFLAALRRREGAAGPGCPVTSIYSVHDNLVSPQATSRLPWARNVALRGVGHVDILLDRRLHALVADEVRAAGVAFVPRA